jgi:hypothetical protein
MGNADNRSSKRIAAKPESFGALPARAPPEVALSSLGCGCGFLQHSKRGAVAESTAPPESSSHQQETLGNTTSPFTGLPSMAAAT